MSIVDELDVSLKDFLPERATVSMAIVEEGLQYVVSQRLHLALKEYAKRNGIPLTVALQLLRSEVHAS